MSSARVVWQSIVAFCSHMLLELVGLLVRVLWILPVLFPKCAQLFAVRQQISDLASFFTD